MLKCEKYKFKAQKMNLKLKNLTLLAFMITVTACSQQHNYSIKINKDGDIIRLNEQTGDVCVVGENCDISLSKLKAGKIYHYRGGDIFTHIPNANCQLVANPEGVTYSEWKNFLEKIEKEDLKSK